VDRQNHVAQLTRLQHAQTHWAVLNTLMSRISTKHRPCGTFRYRMSCQGRQLRHGHTLLRKELPGCSRICRGQDSGHMVQTIFASSPRVLGQYTAPSNHSTCNNETMARAELPNFCHLFLQQCTNWWRDRGNCREQCQQQTVAVVVLFPGWCSCQVSKHRN